MKIIWVKKPRQNTTNEGLNPLIVCSVKRCTWKVSESQSLLSENQSSETAATRRAQFILWKQKDATCGQNRTCPQGSTEQECVRNHESSKKMQKNIPCRCMHEKGDGHAVRKEPCCACLFVCVCVCLFFCVWGRPFIVHSKFWMKKKEKKK